MPDIPTEPTRAHPVQVDALRVEIGESTAAAARAAAAYVADAIATRQHTAGEARVVFAAAPSQTAFLAELVHAPQVDWTRVTVYHMDEYLGLSPDHPAAFRSYLREHIFEPAGLDPAQLRLIQGEQTERPLRVCLEYEELLRREPPDVVCAGIGENGHLAFNDPPVADFLDPVWVKVVRLDAACRRQQVNDGCFATVDEVPTHAYTLTIPALLSAPVVSVVVPGSRKAEAVRATLFDPINEVCPATALRTKVGAVLWLDRDSAARIL